MEDIPVHLFEQLLYAVLANLLYSLYCSGLLLRSSYV